jgi:hypothetical protein
MDLVEDRYHRFGALDLINLDLIKCNAKPSRLTLIFLRKTHSNNGRAGSSFSHEDEDIREDCKKR